MQALFFDWLSFDAASGFIMDVEPGALVILRSMSKYPAISVSHDLYLHD